MVNGVWNGWTICDTSTRFRHDSSLFFRPARDGQLEGSLRWTWKLTLFTVAIMVKQPFLCLCQVSQIRRSWVTHARCIAFFVGSIMIFAVFMPDGGYDEDYITELEVVEGGRQFSSFTTTAQARRWQ